jgi:hypothetical protein
MSRDEREPIELAAPARPSRHPRWAALSTVVLLAVLGATVLLGRDDAVEVSVDRTERSTTTTAPEPPGPDGFPTPLALGGPTDGKESVGLPVKAEPATGLVDGQEVVVTGTGFPPGVSVGVVMCAREAGRDHGARGVEACNIGRFAQTEADADGVASVSFAVRRLLVLDGRELDCASEAQRCLIGMGMISDYDTSGGVLVDFDPAAPLPERPSASAEPAVGLVDGDEVLLRVTGLYPGTDVGASICDGASGACVDVVPVDDGQQLVGPDGTYERRMRVWRHFAAGPWAGPDAPLNVDCAATPCHLSIWGAAPGDHVLPTAPLEFAGGPPARVPAKLRLWPPGPLRAGQEVTATIEGHRRAVSVEPVLCAPSGECLWLPNTVTAAGSDLQLEITVPVAAELGPCLDRPCRLVVNVYAEPRPEPAAPPLIPDAVDVVVEP